MPGNVAKILPITVVGVMLVMAPMALAQPGTPGENPLDFFLSDDDSDDGKIMYKEDGDVASGVVSLTPSQSCQLWHADEAALVDLTFADTDANDEVEYTLDVTLLAAVNEITVSVGPISPDGVYQATASATGTDGTFSLDEDLTVLEDGYLGFRVCAVFATGTSGTVDINTDGTSWVSMTQAPPPTYPTPELGTLLLSGVGLLAIAGVNRIRRG